MKTISTIIIHISIMTFLSSSVQSQPHEPNTIYDFKMDGLNGKSIDFSSFKGKKILLVNTASKCGRTPQYADLQKLHEMHSDQVVVLGFPANNFLWQEPGTNEEIAAFCQKNYGVTFQMFEKISVKGSKTHPLYQWLKRKTNKTPDWNFAKYLVNANGTEVLFFKSSVKPLDKKLLSAIHAN